MASPNKIFLVGLEMVLPDNGASHEVRFSYYFCEYVAEQINAPGNRVKLIQRLQNLLRCSACRQLALVPEHETNDLGDSFVVFGWDHVVDLNASIERLRQRRILDDGYAGLTREFTNADNQVIHAIGNEHERKHVVHLLLESDGELGGWHTSNPLT